MKLNEFIKLYTLRAKNISWFFGAGTSVAAGIPTANQMIWDFKRKIYCINEQKSVTDYNAISNSAIRNQIQSYFDNIEGAPNLDSSDEYSYYFEELYKEERDRSEYISRMVSNIQPSYGHKVLGVLMKMGELNQIITTNFDKAIENTSANIFGNVDKLYVASIDNNTSALKYIQDKKQPLLIKIHGDYHSRKIKNISSELNYQDNNLKESLKLICLQQGVSIIGYSGRDNSVLEVFEEAINIPNSFPHGLFWFCSNQNEVLPRVKKIIDTAKEKGIEADFVDSVTFDDTFSDIIKAFENIPADLQSYLDSNRSRLTAKPLSEKGNSFPVIRINAIPIIEFPSIARLIDCEIGGAKELQEAINQNKSEVIAIRKKEGVIGFGSDADFQKLLVNYNIKNKSTFPFSENGLKHEESVVKDLFIKSICKAFTNNKELKHTKKGNDNYIYPDLKYANSIFFKNLNELYINNYGKMEKHEIFGNIPSTKLKWVDAVKINISFNFSTLYLIITPTILAQKTIDITEQKKAAAYIKEKNAQRLNKSFNDILDSWIKTLFNNEIKKEVVIESHNNIDGISAKFKLITRTIYSKNIKK
jgi:NAD-dependent SIR2 family protein deacetylase